MSRYLRVLLGLAASLVLLMIGTPGPAHSDGIAIPVQDSSVEMPAQQAIIVWDEERGHEDLILSVELRGSPEAAWVVPVPSLPEVETASPEWFEQLSEMTKPKIEHRVEKIYYSDAYTQIVGEEVVVIGREEVGIYDVSILSADEAGALVDWLNENGYVYPKAGEPLLDSYMAQGGWYFVAARVLPEESARLNGDVHPLWFSFETERPIYPMRLTSLEWGNIHVLIYILADHRMEIPRVPFETEFAGELTLEPVDAENAEVVELLTQRPYYVTKLRNEMLRPAYRAKDIYFEQSASDESYRKVVVETEVRYVRKTEPREWLGLGLMLGLIGALIALGVIKAGRNLERD